MIKLVTESYCENCPDFEATVDKLELHSIPQDMHDTLITCANRDRCAAMYERLKRGYRDE